LIETVDKSCHTVKGWTRRNPDGGPASVTLELINPEKLPTPASYTQVIVATASRLVFVARQVADDAQGDLVAPGDLASQARQAFANVGRALVAAGARPDQVTKLTIYVVRPPA
jgi:enamine deaminase RidA (YjgF/YER057c/UK114 family)